MTREDELKAILRKARDELYGIEGAKKAKTNAKFVGKFYKYRNCYSCPKSPEDYWWYYVAVTNMANDGVLMGWSFQKDQYGKIDIGINEPHHVAEGNGYHKITKREFYEAYGKTIEELQARQG